MTDKSSKLVIRTRHFDSNGQQCVEFTLNFFKRIEYQELQSTLFARLGNVNQ